MRKKESQGFGVWGSRRPMGVGIHGLCKSAPNSSSSPFLDYFGGFLRDPDGKICLKPRFSETVDTRGEISSKRWRDSLGISGVLERWVVERAENSDRMREVGGDESNFL